ncbi:hypothetical protein EB796_005645 [Bugula neritina]|uniref:Uncharacterized protein n=1 Tax=Bugula neritina TaxID=10212 RepID=A0A7J7KBL8_BUGNE|nr:hypothetical protein EB796_005645 [Bugula neritina]
MLSLMVLDFSNMKTSICTAMSFKTIVIFLSLFVYTFALPTGASTSTTPTNIAADKSTEPTIVNGSTPTSNLTAGGDVLNATTSSNATNSSTSTKVPLKPGTTAAAAGKEFLEAPRQEAEDSMSSPATKSSVFKDSKFKKDSYTALTSLAVLIILIALLFLVVLRRQSLNSKAMRYISSLDNTKDTSSSDAAFLLNAAKHEPGSSTSDFTGYIALPARPGSAYPSSSVAVDEVDLELNSKV